MSAPVYKRVRLNDEYNAQKAAVKTISYEHSSESTSDKPSERFQRQRLNYRPFVLRPLALILLFVVTIILIGILEWAVIHFPHRSVFQEARNAVDDVQDGLSRRSPYSGPNPKVERRTARIASSSFDMVMSERGVALFGRSDAPLASKTSIAPPSSSSFTWASMSSDAFIRSESKPAAAPTPTTPDKTPAHSTKSSPEKQGPSSAKQTRPTGTGNANGNDDGDENGDDNGNSDSNRNGSGNGNGNGGDNSKGDDNSKDDNNSKDDDNSSGGGTDGGNGSGNGNNGGSRNGNGHTGTGTGTGKGTRTAVETTKASQTHASKNGSPPASRYSSRLAAHTNGVGDKHGGAYYSGSASRSGLPTSASTNALSGGFGTDTGNQDQQQHTPLGGAGTFASSYLPTISAVLYRMIWDVVANSFTLLEPFRLLARPEGASSAALFSAYQKKPHLLECIRNHHWPLGIITIASSLADLLPALASESVLVNTDWPGCPNRHLDSPMNPCPRRVEVLVTVIRSMQALLAFACVILLWLLAFFFFGSTGLADDPSSIAAVASLMSNDGLLQDLNRIPGNADTGEMRRLLSHNQYRLGYFEAEPGEIRYGIEPGAYSDDLGIVTLAHKYGPIVDRSGLSSRRKRRPQNNWVLDVILLVFILGTSAVILAYHFDSGSDGFNKFFNSGDFGPGFVLTLAGTVIATLWKRAEISMMVMAPYQRLAKKPCTSDSTISFKASTTPLISTARALRGRYFVVAAVSILVLLADLCLSVVIGGVAYQRGQSLRQYRVSRWLSIGTLAVMFFAAVWSLISRLRGSYLPQRPDTLGVVMKYLAGGRLSQKFEGAEDSMENEKDSMLRDKKYQLFKMKRVGGTESWTIDEVDHEQPKY